MAVAALLQACALVLLVSAAQTTGETLNVFGTRLEACGSSPGSGEGSQCTYRSYDAGAHQVCVHDLPYGFSSDTGQGPWSNKETGREWCICIWAYASYTQEVQKELDVSCHALPEEVLLSDFSLQKFQSGSGNFQNAISQLCQTCESQALNSMEADSLKARCDAIIEDAAAQTRKRGFGRGVKM